MFGGAARLAPSSIMENEPNEERERVEQIPARTERWPGTWRAGFGALAFLPTVLLAVTVLALLVSVTVTRGGATTDAVPMLFYTHVGAQFLTLLVFGKLMIENPKLTGAARGLWVVGFLFLAPVAIPLYWWIHVVNADKDSEPFTRGEPSETTTVHVYDHDYTSEGPREPAHAREDGAVIHPVPERLAT